jgi:tRNA isopentenyl-2-thiomethyl-A-37 hydroxylase MiaE
MKNSFKLLSIILIIIFNVSAKAEVITTYSINSTTIQKIDKLIDEDTVVFVELDDVLVRPQSKMFDYGDNPHRLFIDSLVALAMENSRYLNQIATWYQMRKIRLVEDGWQDFINNLKKRKIPVYGLCFMPIQLQNIE